MKMVIMDDVLRLLGRRLGVRRIVLGEVRFGDSSLGESSGDLPSDRTTPAGGSGLEVECLFAVGWETDVGDGVGGGKMTKKRRAMERGRATVLAG